MEGQLCCSVFAASLFRFITSRLPVAMFALISSHSAHPNNRRKPFAFFTGLWNVRWVGSRQFSAIRTSLCRGRIGWTPARLERVEGDLA